ncbi:MAG: hypothetical protein JNN27_20430 [Planctomycetes bacterium]|nr:hypothetical protein [Planctomycetota bacterium]
MSCYNSSSSKVVLPPVGDTYASEELVVPRSLIEAAREAAYASRNASRDVLVEIGLDSAYFEAAPAKIAAVLVPHSSHESSHARRTTSEEWAALVSETATREEITRRLEDIVVDRRPTLAVLSAQKKMEITLPGDAPITITHEGFSPFYLPWRVVAGDDAWTTSDVRLTRALAPLIWTERSFDDIVAQWREDVLSDVSTWRGLDEHADSVLSRRLYAALGGFAQAAVEWRAEDATCSFFAGLDGETLFLDLRAQRARSVDAIRWYVPIVRNRPANDWNELLKLAEAAERAVAARPWLVKWKSATRDRSIELQAVGASPYDPHRVDEHVLQAWRKAALAGSPEFEFLLRNGREAHATIYLSGADRSGLVFESSLYRASGDSMLAASIIRTATDETSYFDADGKAHTLR